MLKRITTPLLAVLFIMFFSHALTADDTNVSQIVKLNKAGQLEYIADDLGNIIPDFSHAGYKGNNEPIPYIGAMVSISPVDGDNTQHIQQAIDKLASFPLQSNGFRGALLLEKGQYSVSGQLIISQNGIVIRGVGQTNNDTVIIASGTHKRSLFHVKGKLRLKAQNALRQKIIGHYIPVGTRSLQVADVSAYRVGQEIIVKRHATQEWIKDIGMDSLPPRDDGRKITQWSAKKYHLKYERTITAIQGNTITIDIPLVQMMQQKYAGGEIYPVVATGRVTHIGIENMMLFSQYKEGQINSDEDHSWIAIEMSDVENSWVSDITAYHFAKSLVEVQRGSRFVTVRDSTNLDPASQIKGSRRYAFGLGGSTTLFLRCNARNGRHDYITFSRTTGPNAFVYGTATQTHSDIGPHMRWATGTLYDNIHGGDMNTEDRNNFGSGHGWSGAQQVFWNTRSTGETAVQSPPGAINWSIGHVGERIEGRWSRPQGIWLSHGKHVNPQSLFVQQLNDRIGLQKATAILAKREYERH